MKEARGQKMTILVGIVGFCLLSFYLFLAYRAWEWAPLFAVKPTEREIPAPVDAVSALGKNDSVARGRLIFLEMRCGVCHGPNGEGGVKNPNADPDGMVPDLRHLAGMFAPDDVKYRIQQGSEPPQKDDNAPAPPLSMPAWGNILSDRDMNDVVRYLFSLKAPRQAGEKMETLR